jgi:uncharacterized protein (TIGR02996 family)
MRLTPRIKERVRREFFPEDHDGVIEILKGWDTKDCAPGEARTRMQSAVLNLACGQLSALRWAIAEANGDFRDVLWWGEGGEFEHLRSVPCEPGEEMMEPVEAVFLDEIRANPSDNTARLVYADWLEERGSPRAAYLRVLCAWLVGPNPDDDRLIRHEQGLRPGLDPAWLARVRGMSVREKKQRRKKKAQ